MAKFNLSIKSPPLTVRSESGEFQLLHKYLNGLERAAAVEALARGISIAQEIMWEHVIGWEGVETEDGAPMMFQRLGDDGHRVHSNLPAVMGRIPWAEQLRVLLIQYAMNGVRLAKFRALIADFVTDPADLDMLEKELDGFFSKASGALSKAPAA